MRDLTKENLSSPFVKHVVEDHGGQPIKFTVETTKKFFDALSRQADEGVWIYKNQENVINLKVNLITHKLREYPWKNATREDLIQFPGDLAHLDREMDESRLNHS